jgi:hypothetical protein
MPASAAHEGPRETRARSRRSRAARIGEIEARVEVPDEGGTVDLWCQSHVAAPKTITLDIDDTADTVRGTSNCRCSTLIATSGAFCRFTFTMPTRAIAC